MRYGSFEVDENEDNAKAFGLTLSSRGFYLPQGDNGWLRKIWVDCSYVSFDDEPSWMFAQTKLFQVSLTFVM